MSSPTHRQALLLFAGGASASAAAAGLFKHGSELIFGVHGRTLGFCVLALAMVCFAMGLALLIKREQSQQQSED